MDSKGSEAVIQADTRNQEINFTIGRDTVANTTLESKSLSLEQIFNFLKKSTIGPKDGPYFLRGSTTINKRADKNMDEIYFAIIDGDKSRVDGKIIEDIAPIPELVHRALVELNLTHVLYTTHSHGELMDDGQRKVKFRAVILCATPDWRGATRCIVDKLNDRGIGVVMVKEMLSVSNPWYFPRTDEARKHLFESYVHYGKPLVDSLEGNPKHPEAFPHEKKGELVTKSTNGQPLQMSTFISKFNGVVKTSDYEYKALCPAHDDNNPSLGIKWDSKRSKTIFNCLAGCQPEDILNAIKLSWSDLPSAKPDTGSPILNGMMSLGITRLTASAPIDVHGGKGSDWPDLVPLETPNLPSIDIKYFPDWAGDYVRALSEATETPIELATGMVLAACATATARALRVRIAPDYFEPTNLWVVNRPGVIGDSLVRVMQH